MPQYQLAAAVAVNPTTLSGFAMGRLSGEKAEELARRIEQHLQLAPGTLDDGP
jgi:hypothetical protein